MATQSWKNLNVPLSLTYGVAAFYNAYNGIVAGGGASIVTTADGGINWKDLSSRVPPSIPKISTFRGVAVSGTKFACVVGDDGATPGKQIILTSEDGGENWIDRSSNVGTPEIEITILTAVSFVSENQGWAVGAGIDTKNTPATDDDTITYVILTTNDGGKNWVHQRNNKDDDKNPLNDVAFLDEKNGLAVGDNGVILKTTNGGNDWEVSRSPKNKDFQLIGVSFPESNFGCAVGRDNIILVTKDGGNTWNPPQQKLMTDPKTTFLRTAFADALNGLVVGSNGSILLTEDGGDNFKIQDAPDKNPGMNILGVAFPDSSNGYAFTPNFVFKYHKTFVSNTPPVPTHAVRLIFEYEGAQMRLVTQQPVEMVITGIDTTQELRPGYYVDTRDSTDQTLARVPARNVFETSIEVFPERHDEPITRIEMAAPRGAFTVVVPVSDRDRRVTLTQITLGRPPSGPEVNDLASFPLESHQ